MAKRILVPLDEAVQAESMVEAIGALARSTGATVRLLHVAPVPESLADDYGHVLVYADLIAMTTRGRGCIERALLGSVAEQVFRKAPMAVTLYRAPRDPRAS